MATADFKINTSVQADRGYDATTSEAITLTLENSPAVDVSSVVYSVVATSDGAPALTLSPSTGIPTTPTGNVTFTMPGSGFHSYLIQCQVNAGKSTNNRGVLVVNADYTKQRIIAIRGAVTDLRKTVPAETTQYESDGWSVALNELMEAQENGSVGGIPTTRTLTAGAGLTGGGDLSSDRTFNVVAHADASIVVNANDIQVGALGFTRVQTALAAASGDVSVNSQKVTNLATPSANTDAATKAYVDNVAIGLDVKASVLAATTANITLSGTQTIDGVSVTATKRVLVKDQSTGSENGIYVCAAGAWARATDLAAAATAAGAFTFVEQGTSNGDKGFVCTTNAGSDVVGTDSLAFTTFTGGGGAYIAGNGLNETPAGTFVVLAEDNTIDVGASGIKVATGRLSNTHIDAAAAIAGTKIDPAFGAQNISTTGTLASGAATIAVADSATGAGTTGLTLKHNTSGTAGTNFDIQIPVVLENGSNADKTAAILIFRWTNATSGNENCQLAIRMMGAGGTATTDRFTIGYDGNTFSDYMIGSNGFVCLNNTGFRHNDGNQNGGGYDTTSGDMRAKVYDSKRWIVSLGGAGGSGLTETFAVASTAVSSTVPIGFPSYTVAGVPSAATAGRMIYVSDESGGAVMAFSDGTNWRRVTDRAVVT